MHLLGDADLERLLPMERALALVRVAIADAESGRLRAPARVAADLGVGRLTFTAGAVEGSWVGYRSYLAPGDQGEEQVVVVSSHPAGQVQAVYAGHHLGPIRTGAIGGVAVDVLAPPGPVRVGLVGTGQQAWQQVRAICAARGIVDLAVHSRDRGHREGFTRRCRDQLGLAARSADSARAAVEGADVVVLATSSPTPVIESAWVGQAAVVSTLGPKQVGRHEFPVDLVDRADLVVTDSLAQLDGYDPPAVARAAAYRRDVVTLGSRLGTEPAVGCSLFLSVGLAGTEAHLLHAITSDLR